MVKHRCDIFENHIRQLLLINKSNIIKLEDIDVILRWFEKKPLRFLKLLDCSKDGASTNTFESKCANKNPTMIFVQSANGCRFGGFTSAKWTNGQYVKDSKAFLFSLDKKEKYNITNENNAIYLSSGKYFAFGNTALCISTNCISGNYNSVNNSSFETVPPNYGINGGYNSFTVSYYEVYQIEYQ